jgi:hypothetical protein
MPQKIIDIVFDADGNASVETKGFAGKSCLEATADLERELGSVTAEKKTADFLKVATTTQVKNVQTNG